MQIILVVTNTRGKNLAFLSDSLKTLSLQETIDKVKMDAPDDLLVVNGKYGEYLRGVPNRSEKDNLDRKAVTAADIMAYANRTRHFNSTDAISLYTAQYIASIIDSGQPFIETVDGDKASVSAVRDIIISNSEIILKAAQEYDIDHFLLGAILIDEIVRMSPFEEIRDKFLLQLLGRNVSVGLAQVKLETANGLIKNGLYNPNPDDKNLPFAGNLRKADRKHLYKYVAQPKHNIHFAAARIRGLIKEWSKYIDISDMPEILGTLYHRSYVAPHARPKPNKRGMQVAEGFYKFSKKWLKS
ncbi:MAG: hypothetical protein COU11_01705 [Candidatus Harrisonbacteria bacterium CG10_big_fil_rev_8_21_14_0_10_49_15]|uniref:Uncharacterized protein n=1 Tax=Candidatus Harrisonbacteria bacterium CG10_big_fil_rev_8_21_14_0_10_49_15 TaxID=1974587 RepID=A0A2H0UL85_9BACT|nr:MAG: hypothetical protein COU11_01705 [Candidatus Harrisonbacteria bacterium CG10_big_fil_rev_8_21_14_0_10_49_15]